MNFPTRIVLLFFVITSLPFSTLAQQTPPTPDAPAANPPAQSAPATATPAVQQSPADKSPDKTKDDKSKDDKSKDAKNKADQGTSGEGKVAGTSNDRLFLALPNFLTLENVGKVPPLTTGQKFKVVALGSFDKVQLPWYGFLSAISQAENSEPGYGQGWEGYGKRFGSAFADGTLENFVTSAVLPSLLQQDPRFFQSSEGGFWHRADYAVSRIFVTRTDSGKTQFNYSEVVGSAISAAISTNTYHPRAFITVRYVAGVPTYVHNASDRTLPNTASVWGTQVGYDTITYVVKEFWPDIHRKMNKKRNKAVALQPAAANP